MSFVLKHKTIFWLLVILCLFGVTLYFWSLKTKKEILVTQNINIISTNVSDWKTYTNSKNGIKIKYPNNWNADWIEYTEYNKASFKTTDGINKFIIAFNNFGDLPFDIKNDEAKTSIAGIEKTRFTFTDEPSVGAKDEYFIYTSFCYENCRDFMPNTNYSNMILTLHCPIKNNSDQEKIDCNILFDRIVSTIEFTNK